MSENQANKVDEFLVQRCFEAEYDEFFQRNLACKLFGMNHLWWAEDIFNRPGTGVLNYQSSLNEKNVEKFLSQSKVYAGWNEEF